MLLCLYRFLASELWKAVIYDFHRITMDFEVISSILNFVQIAPPQQKEAAANLLFLVTWKQPLFLKEFVANNGLQIVTQSVLRHRRRHSDHIVVQVLQIVSCAARKSEDILPRIEGAGVLALIPALISSDGASVAVREKTCNLIGNLCKHSDRFLAAIGRESVLRSLCECTANAQSANMRRFACYAIGNIAYQTTRGRARSPSHSHSAIELTRCIEPLARRLSDRDFKTQENAAGAIGNLVSSPSAAVIAEFTKHGVVRLLLRQIRQSGHLCVVRNCLYSLSNVCHFGAIKAAMAEAEGGWRRTLKSCLEAHGHRDQFVKKCAFKILRKMETNTPSAAGRMDAVSVHSAPSVRIQNTPMMDSQRRRTPMARAATPSLVSAGGLQRRRRHNMGH